MHISKSQTFSNVTYNSLLRGSMLICQLLATTVVARNLSAADMGVVGFANIIILFLVHFADCGIGNAMVCRTKMEQHNLETAFTLKIILGAGSFGAAMLVSPFVYLCCDHPAAANITRFLALNYFVSTIGFLSQVVLTREMNFKALVLPGFINAAVRAALAITLIYCGWKFWAIAVADVCANLAGGIASQCVRKVRMRFRFDREDAKELLAFGLPLLGSGLLVFLLLNLANFMVGAKLGLAELGYYALALNWGSFISGLLADIVLSVMFPVFAAIQQDTAKLRRWYLKTLDLVTFVAIVVNTALLANARSFLIIFLGKGTEKWVPALVALQIFCVYGIIRAVTEPIGNCVMVRGQTNTLMKANLLAGVIQIPLLALALLTKRIEWVAVAFTLSFASQALIFFPFLRRELDIRVADLVRQLWPVVPAVILGWGLTHLVFAGGCNSWFMLATSGLFTAMAVALTHGALTRFRCFQETADLILLKFGRDLPKKKSPAST